MAMVLVKYHNLCKWKCGRERDLLSLGFSTPDFSVIYMDYELFWEIEELTSDKLRIYETYKDPVTVPGQSYRDYQQYEAVVLN